MIDGIWWLVILSIVFVALWLLARSRGVKSTGKNQHFVTKGKSLGGKSPSSKKPLNQAVSKNYNLVKNDPLQKTVMVLKKYFPNYQVTRRTNHLLISKQNTKVAMITIDKSIAVGQRRLGDVPVVNYHQVPSRAELKIYLTKA